MKKIALVVLTCAALGLVACGRDEQRDNRQQQQYGYGYQNAYNSNQNGYGYCGNSYYPSNYCTSFTPGQYAYNSQSYYYQSGFQGQYYGCPAGYQLVYTGNIQAGSNFTCVHTSYWSGYTPYCESNYNWGSWSGGAWFGSWHGQGPAQACVGSGTSCGYGGVCYTQPGSQWGVCTSQGRY